MNDLPALLLNAPYKAKFIQHTDRLVDVVVELVAKNDRKLVQDHVCQCMEDYGYDLLKVLKSEVGDLHFSFTKNRIVDWDRYQKLESEWYEALIEDTMRVCHCTREVAFDRVHHPYLGFSPPKSLLKSCTTNIA